MTKGPQPSAAALRNLRLKEKDKPLLPFSHLARNLVGNGKRLAAIGAPEGNGYHARAHMAADGSTDVVLDNRDGLVLLRKQLAYAIGVFLGMAWPIRAILLFSAWAFS